MPTIELSYKDMCSLVGRSIPMKEFQDEAILYVKGEIDALDGDNLKLDIKDTNRPDLWSVEGIARQLRCYYTAKPAKYQLKKSGVTVIVEAGVNKVRPYTVCAVVRNIKITETILSQLIQLQEKVCGSFGRRRREVAIGVYDLHKIKPPIRYTTVKPDGIRFIPLETNEEMTPTQILKKHPKGIEYGHLLAGSKEYPIFIDSAKNVLSLPPIINSDYTGKITENTKDIFIECSGFKLSFLLPAINVVATAMAERGGQIETVDVKYADRVITTPDLTAKRIEVNFEDIRKISGLDISDKDIQLLLKKMGYEIIPGKKTILEYPAYRQDIMHGRDVAEDVIIAYGYNKIEPHFSPFYSKGGLQKKEISASRVKETAIGLGLQEILSYTLTNKDNLFDKMEVAEEKVAEIENPASANWCVFRTWLLPGILEFFSKNKHVEYPQCIFEIGDVILLDEKTETRTRDVNKIAAGVSDFTSSYENISSQLDGLLANLGIEYKLKRISHPSFIEGRSAEIIVKDVSCGIIGEINPKVLENWNLEKPVAAFELNLENIL